VTASLASRCLFWSTLRCARFPFPVANEPQSDPRETENGASCTLPNTLWFTSTMHHLQRVSLRVSRGELRDAIEQLSFVNMAAVVANDAHSSFRLRMKANYASNCPLSNSQDLWRQACYHCYGAITVVLPAIGAAARFLARRYGSLLSKY
jgi:hypothetical protein